MSSISQTTLQPLDWHKTVQSGKPVMMSEAQVLDELDTIISFIDKWITELDGTPAGLAAMTAAEDEIHAQEASNV